MTAPPIDGAPTEGGQTYVSETHRAAAQYAEMGTVANRAKLLPGAGVLHPHRAAFHTRESPALQVWTWPLTARSPSSVVFERDRQPRGGGPGRILGPAASSFVEST